MTVILKLKASVFQYIVEKYSDRGEKYNEQGSKEDQGKNMKGKRT